MATPKKYICAFCARAFTRSEHKQRHERSHTNEKPYHCLHCTSSFVRRDLLQRHCRTVHNVQLARTNSANTDLVSTKPEIPLTNETFKNENVPLELQADQSVIQISPKRNKSDSSPSPEEDTRTDVVKNHDLIHLLSITRKLELLLQNYSPDNASYNVNDYFLIGYVDLISSTSNYTIFEKIIKELMQYLNSCNLMDTKTKHMIPPNHFKIGVIYAVISMGYIRNQKTDRALVFFMKSWDLLITRLIPNYNNNNNLLDQIEILNNLFLLAYIYLNYNLDIHEEATISDEIILNYLNDISFIIISNLNNVNSINDNLIDINLNLFWNIYILLSTYLKAPPKFYHFFLNKRVNKLTLSGVMLKLSKSIINLNHVEEISNNNFIKMIIISTLSNEYKLYNLGENFLIYTSKNCLHNAIILINKSINVHHNYYTLAPNDSDDSNLLLFSLIHEEKTSRVKLFELFKKNIIIKSPPKFHELLNNYLFIPNQFYNWQLLCLTLYEVTFNCSVNEILLEHILKLQDPSSNLDFALTNFFNYKQNPIEANNNLSIISFPIIFFTNFLNLNIIQLDYNLLQLNFINAFIIEWYLIMNKLLVMIWNSPELFEDNYVIQNIVYLLLDNKKSLNKKLNISTDYDTSPPEDEFLLNNKWFWILKLKFDSIFETWMDFVKSQYTQYGSPQSKKYGAYNTDQPTNNLSVLKMYINKFVGEFVNQEVAKLTEDIPVPTSRNNSVNNGQNNQMFINYNNQPDYESAMKLLALKGNYRRANSISIGVLASDNYNNNNGININSPLLSANAISPNISGIRSKPSSSGSYNSSYSTFPQAPIVSNNHSDLLVLPPILRKPSLSNGFPVSPNSQKFGIVNPDSEDSSRSLKPLLHGTNREDI